MTTKTKTSPSVRLAQYQRDTIRNRAIADAFDAKEKALKAEEEALADRVYCAFTTAKEREAVALLGDAWFRETKRGGFSVNASNGFRFYLHLPDARPVPDRNGRTWTLKEGELETAVFDLFRRKGEHKAARDAAWGKLGVLLRSANTSAALARIWPEGAPYYENLFGEKPECRALAIPVAEVNAALGLPKPAKTTAE